MCCICATLSAFRPNSYDLIVFYFPCCSDPNCDSCACLIRWVAEDDLNCDDMLQVYFETATGPRPKRFANINGAKRVTRGSAQGLGNKRKLEDTED